MTALAFVDTETTGLDPEHHEIWEVGLVLRVPGEDEWEQTWQLPVDLGRADAVALKVGRFHDRREAAIREHGLTSLRAFADEFAELTRGTHLVGAVISFDEERLRRLLRINGACPEWHYHLIDVEALVVGFLAGRGHRHPDGPACHEPPWKSTDLSVAVGVDPSHFDRHTGLGDARWARAIYDAVMGTTTTTETANQEAALA